MGNRAKRKQALRSPYFVPINNPTEDPGYSWTVNACLEDREKLKAGHEKHDTQGNGKPALKTNNVTFMRRSVYSLCFRRLGIKYLDRNHISSLKLLKHNSIDTYKAKNLWLRKILKHTPSKKKGGGVNWRLPIRPQTNHNFFFTFQS